MRFENRRRFLQLAIFAIVPLGISQINLLKPQSSSAMSISEPSSPPAHNPELLRLFTEDQADRQPPEGQAIDWSLIASRDAARLARVKELYNADVLQTGADYYHAALILQHGSEPEDYLLAHEFCIVAIGKGEERAKWLAAASEDRFLMSIDRPQRFGTQYRSEPDDPDRRVRLYATDPRVTDGLRREFNAPSLAEAQEREQLFQE
ncbi:hypothetical protein [Leptolyngbya ohadii]|uniref:hypothetical protein n=1 Tax=Leptolyngbya ohadii TaxID=1962290 RepID=UPI000B59AF5D|nr:hypothetical protein [Leptolyngbya ohadii]